MNVPPDSWKLYQIAVLPLIFVGLQLLPDALRVKTPGLPSVVLTA